MFVLEKLKNFIKLDENILKDIARSREEEFTLLTAHEKKEVKDQEQKRDEDYQKVLIAIDNIPDAFVLTRETIINSIDVYVSTIEDIHSYLDTKYYAERFLGCSELNFRMYWREEN